MCSGAEAVGSHSGLPLLTWQQHIQYIISDGYRRVNLMKALRSTSWGASSKILRLFYVAYIWSKMEYTLVMFTGVVTPLKYELKVIQNICLRLMVGARNTTPIRSMEVEANITPLYSHQDFLLAKLFCKLCAIGQPIMRQPNCFKLKLYLM